MFAVVKSGGKQYLVRPGQVIMVEKLDVEVGSSISMSEVLVVDGQLSDKAVVVAEVLEQRRNKKEIIFKKKRRHNYRRKRGHRQEITVLRVQEIKKQ